MRVFVVVTAAPGAKVAPGAAAYRGRWTVAARALAAHEPLS